MSAKQFTKDNNGALRGPNDLRGVQSPVFLETHKIRLGTASLIAVVSNSHSTFCDIEDAN